MILLDPEINNWFVKEKHTKCKILHALHVCELNCKMPIQEIHSDSMLMKIMTG